MVLRDWLTHSITSISPPEGQLPLCGSSQKAGQIPLPAGKRILASNRPCESSTVPRVLSRADVYGCKMRFPGPVS